MVCRKCHVRWDADAQGNQPVHKLEEENKRLKEALEKATGSSAGAAVAIVADAEAGQQAQQSAAQKAKAQYKDKLLDMSVEEWNAAKELLSQQFTQEVQREREAKEKEIAGGQEDAGQEVPEEESLWKRWKKAQAEENMAAAKLKSKETKVAKAIK